MSTDSSTPDVEELGSLLPDPFAVIPNGMRHLDGKPIFSIKDRKAAHKQRVKAEFEWSIESARYHGLPFETVDPICFPAEFRDLPRWMSWWWSRPRNGEGDPTKVPVALNGSRLRTGVVAQDPLEWLDFETYRYLYLTAPERIESNGWVLGEHLVGHAFALCQTQTKDEDCCWAIDIDNAETSSGSLLRILQEIGGWAHVSPSGGVKVLFRGRCPYGCATRKVIRLTGDCDGLGQGEGSIELLCSGFTTLTAEELPGLAGYREPNEAAIIYYLGSDGLRPEVAARWGLTLEDAEGRGGSGDDARFLPLDEARFALFHALPMQHSHAYDHEPEWVHMLAAISSLETMDPAERVAWGKWASSGCLHHHLISDFVDASWFRNGSPVSFDGVNLTEGREVPHNYDPLACEGRMLRFMDQGRRDGVTVSSLVYAANQTRDARGLRRFGTSDVKYVGLNTELHSLDDDPTVTAAVDRYLTNPSPEVSETVAALASQRPMLDVSRQTSLIRVDLHPASTVTDMCAAILLYAGHETQITVHEKVFRLPDYVDPFSRIYISGNRPIQVRLNGDGSSTLIPATNADVRNLLNRFVSLQHVSEKGITRAVKINSSFTDEVLSRISSIASITESVGEGDSITPEGLGDLPIPPLLSRISYLPLVYGDGRIDSRFRYARERQTLVHPSIKLDIPDVLDKPPTEEAAWLRDMLQRFNPTELSDLFGPLQTMFISAGLTMLATDFIAKRPANVALSDHAGTGKTTFFSILGYINKGLKTVPMTSATETRKTYQSLVGPDVTGVLFDNIEREGRIPEFLLQAVTSENMSERKFGTGETRDFRPCLFFTGNELTISEDWKRRSFILSLDRLSRGSVSEEDPTNDLAIYASENRERTLECLLKIFKWGRQEVMRWQKGLVSQGRFDECPDGDGHPTKFITARQVLSALRAEVASGTSRYTNKHVENFADALRVSDFVEWAAFVAIGIVLCDPGMPDYLVRSARYRAANVLRSAAGVEPGSDEFAELSPDKLTRDQVEEAMWNWRPSALLDPIELASLDMSHWSRSSRYDQLAEGLFVSTRFYHEHLGKSVVPMRVRWSANKILGLVDQIVEKLQLTYYDPSLCRHRFVDLRSLIDEWSQNLADGYVDQTAPEHLIGTRAEATLTFLAFLQTLITEGCYSVDRITKGSAANRSTQLKLKALLDREVSMVERYGIVKPWEIQRLRCSAKGVEYRVTKNENFEAQQNQLSVFGS